MASSTFSRMPRGNDIMMSPTAWCLALHKSAFGINAVNDTLLRVFEWYRAHISALTHS